MDATPAPAASSARRRPHRYRDPLAEVDLDRLDKTQPWLPEELVSLAGLAQWRALDAPVRLRLAQLEFVALADLGLWLEAHLLRHLGRAAPKVRRLGAEAYAAQLAELREEAGHSLMFLELLRRSPCALPGDLPRPRLAAAFAGRLGAWSGLFWGCVLIGETVATELNRRTRDAAGVPAVVRDIAGLHFADEVRHVAYARLRVADAFARRPHRLAGAVLRPLARQYIEACFYPPPSLYAAAGAPDAPGLARAARANPARQALAATCLAPARRFLAGRGVAI